MADACESWTEADIGDQEGRAFLVTGANSGLGFRIAAALAGAGATVLMGCRSGERAAEAMDRIRAAAPGADLAHIPLDLASLASVEAAAADVAARVGALDVLVNNAGVMAPPRRETADGFELQFGTNHLGHFALTGRLIETLLASPSPRVVTLSSTAHRIGRIDFEDLNSERGYSRWPAYGQSKLANLLFTVELARRAEAAGTGLVATAAHPGYAATNLQTAGTGLGRIGALLGPAIRVGNLVFAQNDEAGAVPALYAATAPGVRGDDFYGPDGPGEMRGRHPALVGRTGRAADAEAARRLWDASEELTGVGYGPLDGV